MILSFLLDRNYWDLYWTQIYKLTCGFIKTENLIKSKQWAEYSSEGCWSWNTNTLATWCEEPTHWKRPWFWERLKTEEKGREWDGWMALPTQWIWVWVGFRSWWWTGKPGVLQSMGSQRVIHDWVTELNWNSWTNYFSPDLCYSRW